LLWKQQFFPVRHISNGKFLEVPRISDRGNPRAVVGPALHGSGCRHRAFSSQLRLRLEDQATELPQAISWAHNCCFSNYMLQPGGRYFEWQLRASSRNCHSNSGAANCLWQLAARNHAVAILLGQNCVVCHQAQRVALCTYLSPPAAATTITINCLAYRFATRRSAVRAVYVFITNRLPPPTGCPRP
jgi:hypothetical protein